MVPCGVRLGPRWKRIHAEEFNQKGEKDMSVISMKQLIRGRCSFRTSDKKMEP